MPSFLRIGFFTALAIAAVFVFIGRQYGPYLRARSGTASLDELHAVCLSRGGAIADRERSGMNRDFSNMVMTGVCTELRKSCTEQPDGEKCREARKFVQAMAR